MTRPRPPKVMQVSVMIDGIDLHTVRIPIPADPPWPKFHLLRFWKGRS